MSHDMVFLRADVDKLREANDRLCKRRRTKKSRLQDRGTFTFKVAADQIEQGQLSEQIKQEMRTKDSRRPWTETRARRCVVCHNTVHNARTYRITIVTNEEEYS
ncbi:hypothetical protein K504DRAFT_514999, partial [Pleomassaria siparia CBS 279.74]